MHNVGTSFDTDVQGQDLLEGAKIPALEWNPTYQLCTSGKRPTLSPNLRYLTCRIGLVEQPSSRVGGWMKRMLGGLRKAGST